MALVLDLGFFFDYGKMVYFKKSAGEENFEDILPILLYCGVRDGSKCMVLRKKWALTY